MSDSRSHCDLMHLLLQQKGDYRYAVVCKTERKQGYYIDEQKIFSPLQDGVPRNIGSIKITTAQSIYMHTRMQTDGDPPRNKRERFGNCNRRHSLRDSRR